MTKAEKLIRRLRSQKLWCIFGKDGRSKTLLRCASQKRVVKAIAKDLKKRKPELQPVVRRPTRAEAKRFGILHRF